MMMTTLTQEPNAVSTPMPNEEVHPIKIVVCENRLEFARSEGMAGVDRQALHRMLDEWIDHQVREAWRVSMEARLRELLDKQEGARA